MMKEKKLKTLKKIAIGLLIWVSLLILLLIIAVNQSHTDIDKNTIMKNVSDKNQVSIGQTLQTEYFNVTVNSAKLYKSIETGNMFVKLPEETGIHYLVLNTTFKNIDNESRLILDGKILIDYNGKQYNFDKSEMIMLEGWGLLLDQINPLTSKTTNLVYKIPSEIAGNMWYQPGRSSPKDIIFLGYIPGQ